MRLLNISLINNKNPGDPVKLEEFFGSQHPPYVILSHTWGNEEVTFQEITCPTGPPYNKAGYSKIRGCCVKAAEDGYNYVWIDTCCNIIRFQNSKWFTRGWTLQELIAPRSVEFYARDWIDLGTKSSRQDEISDITGIDVRVLAGEDPAICNVAERFSWAASRTTTRIEDAAYCLLGLFQVHMALLYGEGEGALIRLQEEILKTTEDYTLLARGLDNIYFGIRGKNALASTLSEFSRSSTPSLGYSELVLDKHTWTDASLRQTYPPCARGDVATDVTPTLSAKGLHICLPLLQDIGDCYHAYLYRRLNVAGELSCIPLRRDQSEAPEANRFERMCSGPRGLRTHYFLPATYLECFTLTRIFIHQKREVPPFLLSSLRTNVILEASATIGFVHSHNCSISTSEGSSTQSLPWKTEVSYIGSFHVRVLVHFADLQPGSDFMVALGRKTGKFWCCILLKNESSLEAASHEGSDLWNAWKPYEHFVPTKVVDRATRIVPIGVVNVTIRKVASQAIVRIHIDDRQHCVIAIRLLISDSRIGEVVPHTPFGYLYM